MKQLSLRSDINNFTFLDFGAIKTTPGVQSARETLQENVNQPFFESDQVSVSRQHLLRDSSMVF